MIDVNAKKTLAIMQPTFLPWVGYFGLIASVNEFVFLDDVQFEKRSWQQRNRIKTCNGVGWLTLPILSKGAQYQKIKDTFVDTTSILFSRKLKANLEFNYRQSLFFDEIHGEIFEAFDCSDGNLADLNISLIKKMCERLGIHTPMRRASQISSTGKKGEKLVSISKALNADVYLSVEGSRGYLEIDNPFEHSGIDVSYFEYRHPTWSQLHGDFAYYTSCIDLLFNEGTASREILLTGLKSKNEKVGDNSC